MPRLGTAVLFALAGVAFFVHWSVTDPTHQGSKSQSDWNFVLGFSAVLLLLAVSLPVYARLVGGSSVFKASLVPAAGAAFGSLSNVVEDGFQMDWAFFLFIFGSFVTLLGLLAFTAVIAFSERGGRRFLALVPAGTMVAVLGYVSIGGTLMLITWLAAALVALTLPVPTGSEM